MKQGVNVTKDEWGDWSNFFSELFPKESKDVIAAMTRRMIKTLSYCGMPKRMDREEVYIRITQLNDSLGRAMEGR